MIFFTWYLYSPDENMKKLTEARDEKELPGVAIINQINNPPLPWVKDSFKRSLSTSVVPKSPPPPPQRNQSPHPLP